MSTAINVQPNANPNPKGDRPKQQSRLRNRGDIACCICTDVSLFLIVITITGLFGVAFNHYFMFNESLKNNRRKVCGFAPDGVPYYNSTTCNTSFCVWCPETNTCTYAVPWGDELVPECPSRINDTGVLAKNGGQYHRGNSRAWGISTVCILFVGALIFIIYVNYYAENFSDLGLHVATLSHLILAGTAFGIHWNADQSLLPLAITVSIIVKSYREIILESESHLIEKGEHMVILVWIFTTILNGAFGIVIKIDDESLDVMLLVVELILASFEFTINIVHRKNIITVVYAFLSLFIAIGLLVVIASRLPHSLDLRAQDITSLIILAVKLLKIPTEYYYEAAKSVGCVGCCGNRSKYAKFDQLV